MLQWALKYQKLGLSVIPLRPKGKEPLLPWMEFQKRKATEQEIKAWWTKWPQANIGIVTGVISNVIVVDLDGGPGIATANSMNLSSNTISLTGNGKHLWFQCPKTSVPNAVRIFSGIDIRGEGGFVVVPPSIHENGKRYRWIKPFVRNQLQEMPTDILRVQNVERPKVGKEEGWIAEALNGMANGNIDNTLTSVCGRLRSDGYTERDAFVLLKPHADRVMAESGHLEAKIENIWNRYEPNSRKITESSEISRRTIYETGFGGQLVIHSPKNPDSIKQFEQCQSNLGWNNKGSLQTGYPKLDEYCTGGLKSSRLFIVAARTGTGKTNWLLGCAKHLCESGKKVLLFSTEMPYTEIWQRYRSALKDPECFCEHQFYVCDSFAPSIEKVEEALNAIRPDVFMFDHINHVSEEQRELGAFMQGLNYLRRKYDCAGIVTAQLNRSADWVDLKTGEKVTPRMSMVKGSGTIEQAASRVLLLSEKRVLPEGVEIDGMLDKNDNGQKGLIKFMLTNAPYRMVEL